MHLIIIPICHIIGSTGFTIGGDNIVDFFPIIDFSFNKLLWRVIFIELLDILGKVREVKSCFTILTVDLTAK